MNFLRCNNLKWYDYVVCVFIADYIVGMVFAGNILVFIPMLVYELYSEMRKQQVEKERK